MRRHPPVAASRRTERKGRRKDFVAMEKRKIIVDATDVDVKPAF